MKTNEEILLEEELNWYFKIYEKGFNSAILCIARTYKQLDILKASNLNPNNDSIEYELSDNTINWYLKALEYYENNYQLNTEYAYQAGILLSDPEEAIRIDYEKAFKYFLYAANMNDKNIYIMMSRERVAMMYEKGLGCEVDLAKSKVYREKVKYEKVYRYL